MPLAALAALGGAYTSSVLPLLAAAAAAFFISGARVAADRDSRVLDICLVVLLSGIVLQVVPLPASLVTSLSPNSAGVQALFSLDAAGRSGVLSIDGVVTRDTLASAAAVILLFWAARSVFSQGGVRLSARAITWSGVVAALVGLAQRATSPTLLLWTWKPFDPGARPFGPFVNRNHFAMWLLMAGALAVGCTVAHVRSHAVLQRRSTRHRLRDLLADGTGLFLAGSAALMWLTLIASTSRGALLGLLVAGLSVLMMSGRRLRSRGSFRVMACSLVALLGWGIWSNVGALADRFDPKRGELRRETVWLETLPVLRDFPIAGIGAGTYAQAMVQYQRTERRALFNEAHSEYLQLAAEGGLLLVVPALGALLAWIRLARRRLREDLHDVVWIRAGALAGISGVAVQCIWDSALRMPANALLFALLAAIVIHHRQAPIEDPSARQAA